MSKTKAGGTSKNNRDSPKILASRFTAVNTFKLVTLSFVNVAAAKLLVTAFHTVATTASTLTAKVLSNSNANESPTSLAQKSDAPKSTSFNYKL